MIPPLPIFRGCEVGSFRACATVDQTPYSFDLLCLYEREDTPLTKCHVGKDAGDIADRRTCAPPEVDEVLFNDPVETIHTDDWEGEDEVCFPFHQLEHDGEELVGIAVAIYVNDIKGALVSTQPMDGVKRTTKLGGCHRRDAAFGVVVLGQIALTRKHFEDLAIDEIELFQLGDFLRWMMKGIIVSSLKTASDVVAFFCVT